MKLNMTLALSLLALPLLAGCSGLAYMIEEYNSRFGIHGLELQWHQPGEGGAGG